jgi:adenylate cyclase
MPFEHRVDYSRSTMFCEIRFLPSARRVTIRAGEMTLLEATRKAGLPIASACGENGACARCGLQVLVGAENLEPESERERRIKRRNRIDPELRLACRIRPRQDLEVRATYW